MLDMTLDELATDEQREEAMFDIAKRIIRRGIMEDDRVMERARKTILEMTDDRKVETLPDVPKELESLGETKGNGDPEAS